MVMTQSALWFVGALATLATLGMLYEWGDKWENVAVDFATALLWALFGMSSFDVVVATTETAPLETLSEPITPLVYVGIGMAAVSFLIMLNDLVEGVADEASDVDEMSVMGR